MLHSLFASIVAQHFHRREPAEPTPEQMADETLRVCCECLMPAAFGEPTCGSDACRASLAAWTDMDERTEPVCQHEDDGGPFFAKCRKCGATLDDYAGGD